VLLTDLDLLCARTEAVAGEPARADLPRHGGGADAEHGGGAFDVVPLRERHDAGIVRADAA
jgi:hypothetical protein